MKWARLIFPWMLLLGLQVFWPASGARGQSVPSLPGLIHGGNLAIEAYDDGFYALRSTAIPGDVLRSEVEADTAGGTLRSSLYPRHLKAIVPFDDELGSGHLLTVTHTGLAGKPDLVCEFRVYENQPWGEIRVSVNNSTGEPIEVHAIRMVKIQSWHCLATEGACLGGPHSLRQLRGEYSADEVDGSLRGGPWPPPGVWKPADLQPAERAESLSGSAVRRQVCHRLPSAKL